MKRKSICILMVVSSMVCLMGCGATEKNGGEPSDNLTPTLSISDIFQPEKHSGVVGTVEDSEVLGEVLEQIEDTGLEKYNAANRMLQTDAEKDKESLFCIDPDTGVVYFVNQHQDYYIYRLKDGKAELAVPIPAKELYCWDGVLYFMVYSYGRYQLQGMSEGDIYAYNPAKGTVELMYAGGEPMAKLYKNGYGGYQNMIVNEDGIYFVRSIEAEPIVVNGVNANVLEVEEVCLSFESKEVTRDREDRTYPGWKDYVFRCIRNEASETWIALVPREEGKYEEKILVEKVPHLYWYFLWEDDIYMLYDQEVKIISLETGERTAYSFETLMCEIWGDRKGPIPSVTSFTVTEHSIWVLNSGNYVFQIDRTTGEIQCCELQLNVSTLYTDGQSVYALTNYGVARVLTEVDTTDVQKVRSLKMELLVEEQ